MKRRLGRQGVEIAGDEHGIHAVLSRSNTLGDEASSHDPATQARVVEMYIAEVEAHAALRILKAGPGTESRETAVP